MKRHLLLITAALVINLSCFAGENQIEEEFAFLIHLPQDLQKEVLSKLTNPASVRAIARSSSYFLNLVEEMKLDRQLDPAVLWSYKDAIHERQLTGHEQKVNAVALSPDKQMVLSGSNDKTVKTWNVTTGEVMRTFEFPNRVNTLALSPDKEIALIGTGTPPANFIVRGPAIPDTLAGTPTVFIADVTNGKIVRTLDGYTMAVHSVALSDDKQLALIGSYDGTAKLSDATTGELIQTLGPVTDRPSVALSADKKIAIVDSFVEGNFFVWDLIANRLIQTKYYNGASNSVALSADKKIAITGSMDKTNTVLVWDLTTGFDGTIIHRLYGHQASVSSVAISPDGQIAVSGSFDKTAKIWDVATGKLIQTLEGHTGPVTSVAISPDKKMIVTGSDDRTVKIWDVEKN